MANISLFEPITTGIDPVLYLPAQLISAQAGEDPELPAYVLDGVA